MKYFAWITKFRVAYQKLEYVKHKEITLITLDAWVETWCKEENITDKICSATPSGTASEEC